MVLRFQIKSYILHCKSAFLNYFVGQGKVSLPFGNIIFGLGKPPDNPQFKTHKIRFGT